jgi:hypothetical protein
MTMLLNPETLPQALDRREETENPTLRLVTQAMDDDRAPARAIVREAGDVGSDIGEALTRDALDRLGMPRVGQRLFGTVDDHRAGSLVHSDDAIAQALFVDSPADSTLYGCKHIRFGQAVNVQGNMPTVIPLRGEASLTPTLCSLCRITMTRKKDETVFDIRQGVAIALFVKDSSTSPNAPQAREDGADAADTSPARPSSSSPMERVGGWQAPAAVWNDLKQPTPAAHILWQHRRGNQLGVQFRCQHVSSSIRMPAILG